MRNVQLDATAEEYLAGGATILIRPNEYVEVAVSGDDVVRFLPLAASQSPTALAWSVVRGASTNRAWFTQWVSVIDRGENVASHRWGRDRWCFGVMEQRPDGIPACWPRGHAARSRASVIAKWPSVSNWERVAAT